MRIIDPVRRTLPLMQSFQDAAKLNRQERTTFYVSAFMFQAWLSEVSLANIAQIAERPDPTKRLFQSGHAWRAFQKFGGKAGDREFPGVFSDLMEFGQCDDPFAEYICHAMFPLSLEHKLTGQFVGAGASDPRNCDRKKAAALMRSTVIRLCDWLDSELHFIALLQWHVMPECFDADPKKRELAVLGIGRRNFDQLSEAAKARHLNHLADAAVEQQKSPNWATFKQTAAHPQPHRPWPTQTLDLAVIKTWPLVKRYGWSASDLLDVLRKAIDPADLAPCTDPVALVSYCNNNLSLRWSANHTQPSTIHSQHSFSIALRLLQVTGDASQHTTAE